MKIVHLSYFVYWF